MRRVKLTIGSGTDESGIKAFKHRLTGPGLRWSHPATARMLVIRAAIIPKGEIVLAVIASANRDQRQFDNPDRLDLIREDIRPLAFGQGSHYCGGAPLAQG
jgi:cytochrome P450